MAIDLSVVITRDELSLADLELNEAPYKIARSGLDQGEASMRRITTDSPFVDGRTLISAVVDSRTAQLNIRVRRANNADVKTSLKELKAAFGQFTYTIAIAIDSNVITTMQCEVADYSIGESGKYDDHGFRAYQQMFTATIPYFLTSDEDYL